MIRNLVKTMIVLLVLVSVGSFLAIAQDEGGAGPTVVFQAAYPDLHMNYTVVEIVVDLEPGAAFPLHHHGGTVFAMVLEGELTLEQDGNQTIYVAGDSWLETPSDIHFAFNATDSIVRALATVLLPPGNEVTIVEPDAVAPAIGPSIPMQAVFPDVIVDGPFKGVQVVLEFAPGAGMPMHSHGGPVVILVLDGEITLRENGEEVIYGAGDSWLEMPNVHHEAFNNGDVPVHVAATFLLSPDSEPTTIVAD